MDIFIFQNEEQVGPFSIDDINSHIANGTYTAEDFGWYEGAADWMPLKDIEGVIVTSGGSSQSPAESEVAVGEKYFVMKGGNQIGPFTIPQIQAGVKTKFLQKKDQARLEGIDADWVEINSIL
tara:strand:+ start:275 stop:643 length:369 start_codon:yes stop_codon:yes gene_type:complete